MHIARRHLPQLRINKRNQFVEGARFAAFPLGQQHRDFTHGRLQIISVRTKSFTLIFLLDYHFHLQFHLPIPPLLSPPSRA
jgi:hypothetical protein